MWVQITAKPTAKEMSVGIKATVLGTKHITQPGTGEGQDDRKSGSAEKLDEVQSVEQTSDTGDTADMGDSDEVLEPDNYDALSFSSSIFGDGSDSFDARNVTMPNGRLDVDKLMSWSLPTVNLFKILDRSVCKSPNTKNKIIRLMDAQKNKGQPPHSTPAVGNISTVRLKSRKTAKAERVLSGMTPVTKMSEKESIKKMLEDMDI